ncbi:hypothetical protein BDZ45DRAFT_777406 [Acephala macrosclerotiorum]|nr:hypothetical protein BDZ45DRAFT_777406 [Acephala macrosclerotiorum]
MNISILLSRVFLVFASTFLLVHANPVQLSNSAEKHPLAPSPYAQASASPKRNVIYGGSLPGEQPGDLNCWPTDFKWNGADDIAVDNGIDRMQHMAGDCGFDSGCIRVSCSYNAAIWMCNNFRISIPCATVGNYAERIRHGCPLRNLAVLGQQFDKRNFNVIVRKDGC